MQMHAQRRRFSILFAVKRTGTLALLIALSWATESVRAESVLVEVNGETISDEQLDRSLGVRLLQLEDQKYKLKRSELDSQIEHRLLDQEAARRGVPVAAILDQEVTGKVALVTDAEIDEAYQANKARFVGSESMIREKLRGVLQQQKLSARRKEYVATLKSQAHIVDRFPQPSIVRLPVSSEGAPSVGSLDAPVAVVEFSDFHCPFCKRVEGTLKAILERYSSKVQLVYRQFPITGLHPEARRASEASLCAKDQGKFWEYHDVLFDQSPKATDEDLKRYAEQIGLKREQFASCLFESRHHETVQRDIDDGIRLGIEGTPAFFINGRFVNGAQPLEKFVQIIDEELARAESSTAVSMQKQ